MKRPQFTLRDLMWLTVVVALALGWWRERARATIAVSHAVTLKVILEQVGRVVTLWDDGGVSEHEIGKVFTGPKLQGTPVNY